MALLSLIVPILQEQNVVQLLAPKRDLGISETLKRGDIHTPNT
jgi:hypothetical protein